MERVAFELGGSLLCEGKCEGSESVSVGESVNMNMWEEENSGKGGKNLRVQQQ